MNEKNLATLLMEIIPKTMHLMRIQMRGVVVDEKLGDLNLSQFRIMAHLYNLPAHRPSTNRMLADRQGVAVATMSRNVDVRTQRSTAAKSAWN
jgi:DNA-binding MarR family transcriptional regulator